MQRNARTPQEYMEQLPPDRHESMKNLRAAVITNLPKGLEEIMLYGELCGRVTVQDYLCAYEQERGK